MPPIEPSPNRSRRLRKRQQALERQLARVNVALAVQHILLPCGCKVEEFDRSAIKVTYCRRHQTFIFSPRYNGSDVFLLRE